jgi:hypothetical protein
MERVRPGEVALVLVEGLDRVDLEWEGRVAREQAQARQGSAPVPNAELFYLMRLEYPAPLRPVQNVEQKW